MLPVVERLAVLQLGQMLLPELPDSSFRTVLSDKHFHLSVY